MPPMSTQATQLPAVSMDQLNQLASGTLSKIQKDSIELLTANFNAAKTNNEKASALTALANAWSKTGNIIMAGTYFEQLATIDNQSQSWYDAAMRFSLGYNNATDSLVRNFAVNHAISSYQQLIKTDSVNLDYQVGLALAFMDGAGNVMQGVSLLKQVEQKDPDNIQMNLTLGRFGIMSGQFDKAISRLQKVISLSKEDAVKAEAWYQLGEAYRATGKKDDAIKALETSRDLLTNEDFKKQLDIYIQQLKNS